MAEPFIGEMRLFGFNYPPVGWAKCDGALLPITQNPALFSLLGQRYGGDGSKTFKLPDFRGRVPMHRSSDHDIGVASGLETVTLDVETLPAHKHSVLGTNDDGDTFKGGDNRSFARSTDATDPIYQVPHDLAAMNVGVVSNTGGGQAHDNMQPSLVINFCISLYGTYPPRS